MQPSAEAISKLLLTLYAAPARPELWEHFLRDFTRLLQLPAAGILHQDVVREQYGFAASTGFDPAAMALYERHYGRQDPWRPKFLAKAPGELALSEELCTSADLESTEFYADFLARYETTLYCAVATVKQPTSLEFLTIHRGLTQEPPPSWTLDAIRLVVPHVHSALQLRHHLRTMELVSRNYGEGLDALTAGVVLLNERRECVFVSRKAETLCAGRDGLYLRRARLAAHRPDDDQDLQRLIGRAITLAAGRSTQPSGVVSIRRPLGASLLVSAVALSPEAPVLQLLTEQVAVAAVFIRPPDDELMSLPDILMKGYGLTGAEARLCTQLFEGGSLADSAERNKVSRETVRAQLRSIFNKTQVRRQADLLRLCTQLVRI